MKVLAPLLKAVKDALARRAPRERVALALMAGTIVIALWVQLLWSAHHERARYARLVSDLQTQNSVMRQASEIMRGAKVQGRKIQPITAEQALTVFADELRAAGLSAIAVIPDAQGQIRLNGSAGFDAWLGWLAKTQAKYGIQILHVGIEPSDHAGLVKINAVVALAGAG
jgi:type II secretory pathway component PulM